MTDTKPPVPEETTVMAVATVPPIAGKEYFVAHKTGAHEYHTWTGQRWRDRHGRTYAFDEMRAMGYFPGAPALTNGTGSN